MRTDDPTDAARAAGPARVKGRLKAALCGLYKYSGLLPLQEALAGRAGRSSLVILLFHRVTDAIAEDGLTVSTARFRRMCGMLARRFRVVPLAEVFRLARAGRALPARTVAVTFDDSYRDNLRAARVLAEHGLPATFFVPTSYVGTDLVYPWDRGLQPMPNLTWDDLREMTRLGFEVGSHTVTHANLGTASEEQARREIFESKAVLEGRLGVPVRWLAYPFGGADHFRTDWLPLVEQAGYEGCLSGHGGFIRPGARADILPREPVTCFDSNLHLEIHLTGCLEWYYALRRRILPGAAGQVRRGSAALAAVRASADGCPHVPVAPAEHEPRLANQDRTTMHAAPESAPAARVGPAPSRRFSVRVVADAAGLAGYLAAWEQLTAAALEPNVFYEPWMLLPALEAFGTGRKLLFLLVLADEPHGPGVRLSGFAPLERRRLHPGLPVEVLGLWQHLHCYLCTPLVRADDAGGALAALFDWLASDARGAGLLQLEQVTGDGPFARSLREHGRGRGCPIVTGCHERPLLRPRGDGVYYLRSVLSGSRRRALERRGRRLAEAGRVEYVALAPGGDVGRWAEEFLRLEAAGWKGGAGTALGCDPANRRFFGAITRAAFERGRLLAGALHLDGRPVASRCSFLAGDGAFAFKTAYDERYAPYSPGVLLEMDHIRRLHAVPGLAWMDSCTAPDNGMLEYLWPCRRDIHTVLAATGPAPGRLVVALYPWLRRLKRRLGAPT